MPYDLSLQNLMIFKERDIFMINMNFHDRNNCKENKSFEKKEIVKCL